MIDSKDTYLKDLDLNDCKYFLIYRNFFKFSQIN